MNNKEIKQQAAIAVLPKCIESIEKVLLAGGSIPRESMAEHAAEMAVQYAEALMRRLNQ